MTDLMTIIWLKKNFQNVCFYQSVSNRAHVGFIVYWSRLLTLHFQIWCLQQLWNWYRGLWPGECLAAHFTATKVLILCAHVYCHLVLHFPFLYSMNEALAVLSYWQFFFLFMIFTYFFTCLLLKIIMKRWSFMVQCVRFRFTNTSKIGSLLPKSLDPH